MPVPNLSYGTASGATGQNDSGVNFHGGSVNMGGDTVGTIALAVAAFALYMAFKN